METLFLIGLTAAVICFTLLDTEAPEQYLKRIFKKSKLLNPEGPDTVFDLSTRLTMKYPNSFFVSLITCGVCLSVWITAFLCLAFGIFSVIKIGSAIYVAWVSYFGLVLLQKTLNNE